MNMPAVEMIYWRSGVLSVTTWNPLTASYETHHCKCDGFQIDKCGTFRDLNGRRLLFQNEVLA